MTYIAMVADGAWAPGVDYRIPYLAPQPPKSDSAGMTLYGVLRHIQTYLARIIGTCPTCHTGFPEHYPRDG